MVHCGKKQRENYAGSITAPHSRALIQFLNFSDPHSDILVHNRALPEVLQFHRSMELDILAGVHKEIQVTVNGQLQPHYIKAIHYYMP